MIMFHISRNFPFRLKAAICCQLRRKISVKCVEVPSALHILRKHSATVFHSVDPYLEDFDYFRDTDKLQSDLKKRGLNVTINYLNSLKEKCYLKSEMQKALSVLKQEKTLLFDQKKSIEGKEAEADAIFNLKLKIEKCGEQIKDANSVLSELEESFILPYLDLPNQLHSSVISEDVDIFTYLTKPVLEFDAMSHMMLGCAKQEIFLSSVSPNACYLSNTLAVVELAVADFILKHAKRRGFITFSITDFAKAVLAEGCGFDIKNKDALFEIYEWDCLSSSLKQYLVGGASLPCSVVLFCKKIMDPRYLYPFKSVSIGRKYTPTALSGEANLYNLPQSTSASAFIAYSYHSSQEEEVLNLVTNLVTEIYQCFGLHFKLMRYSASNLLNHEARAVGICMFSPFTQSYIEIGRISVCGDYISKRLQCVEGLGQKKGAYLGMVYVEIMNITKWIGCMIENTQTVDGCYVVPDCLEPLMFHKF